MKIRFEAPSPTIGRVFHRAVRELKKRASREVHFVPEARDADLVIEFTLGPVCAARTRAHGKPYVVYPCHFKMAPFAGNEDLWLRLWDDARVVISYFDLSAYAPRFVRLPLGADPEVFKPDPGVGDVYRAMTTGYSDAPIDEPITAVHRAVLAASPTGKALHVGGACHVSDPRVSRAENVADETMVRYYRQSRWVSALRYHEGFELPAVEALFCGRRPFLFNLPCYTDWFGPFLPACCFVPHPGAWPSGDMEEHLRRLFEDDCQPGPVQPAEMAELHRLFSWDAIAHRFWPAILASA